MTGSKPHQCFDPYDVPFQKELHEVPWPHQQVPLFPQDFTRIRILGSGGQGDAVLWQDNYSGNFVVVKTVSGIYGHVNDETMAMLSHQENKHPHIVHYYSLATDWPKPKLQTLWLPYYPDGDLHHWAWEHFFEQGKAIPEDTMWLIFAQLAAAVQYLHNDKFDKYTGERTPCTIHGDIKPANIFVEMMNGQPYIRLGDFGCAKPGDHQCDQPFGSYDFQGPDYYHWKELDIWGVGAVMYYLAKGEAPVHTGEPRKLPAGENTAKLRKILDPRKKMSPAVYEHTIFMRKWPRIIKDLYQYTGRGGAYSRRFHEAVCQCLQYEPGDRCSAPQLTAMVQREWNQWKQEQMQPQPSFAQPHQQSGYFQSSNTFFENQSAANGYCQHANQQVRSPEFYNTPKTWTKWRDPYGYNPLSGMLLTPAQAMRIMAAQHYSSVDSGC